MVTPYFNFMVDFTVKIKGEINMFYTLNGLIKGLKKELEEGVGRCSEIIKDNELEIQNYQLKIMGLELQIGGVIHLGSDTYKIESIAPPDGKGKRVGMDNWLIRLVRVNIPEKEIMPKELIMEVE